MKPFEPRAWLPALILLAGALVAPPITAAPAAKAVGRAAELQKLIDCRKIADNTQRLACFDAAAASFDQAEAKGDIVVVDREQARKVRRRSDSVCRRSPCSNAAKSRRKSRTSRAWSRLRG